MPDPQPPSQAAAQSPAGVVIESGRCIALFAYDIGLAVDLDEAERRLAALIQRERIRHRRRTPRHITHQPAPLRITRPCEPLQLAGHTLSPSMDLVVYDFGAVSVSYSIPLEGDAARLLTLSEALHENEQLLAHSRAAVEELLENLRPAISRPGLSELVEDYTIYFLDRLGAGVSPAAFIDNHAPLIAGVLCSELATLSEQEIRESISCRASYTPDDIVVIDWNAALVIDPDGEDVRAVLEHANVELLEMRWIDEQLDKALDESYIRLSRRIESPSVFRSAGDSDMRRIALLQTDSAILFEGVNNALKLVGDQYLARVYRLAAQRLHLPDWDTSILRKLEVLESLFGKLNDFQTSRRLEILEWIIIILIAVSIVLPFIPGVSY
ncbi:MAG: hypothetical protein EA376_13985 [Phycisphaeraceae bacterium]|nr:MAG: hypothetical protein EA376_13985 [Phycisphaeraceae bacterium]